MIQVTAAGLFVAQREEEALNLNKVWSFYYYMKPDHLITGFWGSLQTDIGNSCLKGQPAQVITKKCQESSDSDTHTWTYIM